MNGESVQNIKLKCYNAAARILVGFFEIMVMFALPLVLVKRKMLKSSLADFKND